MNNSILEISAKENEIEEKFIKFIDENLEILGGYERFFFIRNQVEDNQYIKIYLDKVIINQLKLKSDDCITVEEDESFSITNDMFGKFGDEFLLKFYKISNFSTINIIRDSLNNYNMKINIGLDLLILNSMKNIKSIKEGYFVYVAFVEGFFTRWKDINKIRGIFEEQYLKNKDFIHKKIEILTSECNYNDSTVVIKKMKNLREKMISKFASGELKFFKQEDKKNPDIVSRSEFYKSLKMNNLFETYINSDYSYLSYRLCTVYIYEMLKTIGIKNVDKYVLAYYVYRSVEDLYNLDYKKYIQNFNI